MNEDQQSRLDALVAELESLPNPELVRETLRVIALDATLSERKRRIEAAVDAAISAEMLHSYLPVLRQVEDWRVNLGKQIFGLREQSERLFPEEVEESIQLAVYGSHLSGEQDVVRHFWVVAVGRIQRLLEKLSKEAGPKINSEDRCLLEGYRDLRDYYEHLKGELPGAKSRKQLKAEEQNSGDIHITFGLEMDGDGRTIVGDKRVDVNGRGLRAIEDLVERVYTESRTTAVEKVRAHFRKHPDSIPLPEVVDHTLLVKVYFPGGHDPS